MFVAESIESLLKPKTKQEIDKNLSSMSVEDKQDILLHKLLLYENGEWSFDTLESLLGKKKMADVWKRTVEVVNSSLTHNSKEVSKDDLMHDWREEDVLEIFLDCIDEKDIDYLVNKIMLNESISSVLRPKSKEQIIREYSVLSLDEKKKLLFDNLMEEKEGSYDEALDLLKSLFSNVKQYNELLSIASIKAESYHLTTSKGKKIPSHRLLEPIIDEMTEDELDETMGKLIPGFVVEGVNDVLKPKPQEDIDADIMKMIDINKIREHVEKHKMNSMLCLYIYESDLSSNNYYHAKKSEDLLKRLVEEAIEAYQNQWKKRFVIYKMNPYFDHGKFVDEGFGRTYCDGGINVLLEVDVPDDNEKKIEVELWE